mgnify:CR=1 FL=1
MSTENADNNFELVLRLLGNEIFAIKLMTTSKTNKWLAASVIICGLAIYGLSVFGPSLVGLMN